MTDLPEAKRYYYSAHHLAGDFIWGVGTVSFFTFMAVVVFGEHREGLPAWLFELSSLSTPVVISVVVLYVLIAAATAMMAQRAVLGLRDLWRRLPGRGEDGGYRALYRLRSDELRAIYRRHFPEGPRAPETSLNDMVNRLLLYMKLYNPDGYSHVYRTYAVVGLYRQSIVFSFILLAASFWRFGASPVTAGFVLLLVILLGCLRVTRQRSVAAEFDFVFATSRWVKDHDRVTRRDRSKAV